MSSFSLDKQINGIVGTVEYIWLKTPKTAKVRILDQKENEVESVTVPGRIPKLERIEGTWEGGPVFLISTDQHADFGSYSGVITRPFQIKNGRIVWAKLSKGPEKGHQVLLMQALKNEWKIKPISSARTALDVYEVSCFPDFDHSTDDDVKFNLTYRHYRFDGKQWEAQEKTQEGCWESGGNKFPDYSKFP